MNAAAKAQALIAEARQHLLLGDQAAAEAALRKATRQAPRDPAAWSELGVLLFSSSRPDGAREALARAAAFDPRNPDRHANVAAAAAAAGDADEALAAARRALALAPHHLAALTSQARIQAGRAAFAEARDGYLALLQLAGAPAEIRREALAFLTGLLDRLGAAGDLAGADHCARALACVAPGIGAAWDRLGIDAGLRGEATRAQALCGRAVRLAPHAVPFRLNRAGMAGVAGTATAALADLAIAGALAPGEWLVAANRAAILDKTGDLDPALASARQAVRLNPAATTAWINLIALGLRTEAAAPDQDARQFGAIARQLVPQPRRHARRDAAGRLRIGYYSADLRRHSCAWFIEPLLEHHDRDAVETFAYAEVAAPDDVTARLRPLFDHWRPTIGIDDAALADQVAADGIDILVDLTGLFTGGRPLLFAHRPAPVQIGWLGYNATTGIDSVDWKLVDDVMAPTDTKLEWFAERLWHLPRPAHCWRPPAEAPAPAMAEGRPTFGSFNNLAKLSPATIALWARVLGAVPEARLLLKAEQSGDARVQQQIRARFAAAGVAGERIEFLGYTVGMAAHLALYSLIDVGLDPLPYNGTTTTCEAFWMGVPVVTMMGRRMVGRIGASLAQAIGHGDFIADTPEAYVDIASRLVTSRAALRSLRQGLRAEMAASSLRDEAGFSRMIEDAYRGMMAAD